MDLMATLRRIRLLLLVLASRSGVLLAQSSFFLKDGDRVVFYGDSITDQRLYTTFTETFVLTRFQAAAKRDAGAIKTEMICRNDWLDSRLASL
jgi:hypothetical protein